MHCRYMQDYKNIPRHSSVTSGRSSQIGRTPSPRKLTALCHSSAHISSLISRQSPLRLLCNRLLRSHSLKMKRQRKGSMTSLHCGLGFRNVSPFIRFLAFLSSTCWSIAEGMFSGDDTPEKHVCSSTRVSLQTSPE